VAVNEKFAYRRAKAHHQDIRPNRAYRSQELRSAGAIPHEVFGRHYASPAMI
jgi:hypothetical protein